ncbi:MAG: T9SS type A sorting domain-containing protein [Ignavibacteria bacterium]|nr:T9SS type A sorting domain-containing protein [Ignavibacteria bacterium]
MSSDVTSHGDLTVDGVLHVSGSKMLEAMSNVTVNGTLSGASTSVVALKGSWNSFTLPTESPGATISQVKVKVDVGAMNVLYFSGTGSLESGATFDIDNSSTLKLSGAATIAGGTVNVTSSSKIEIEGYDFTVDGATINGPGTLYYNAPENTFTNDGTVSAPTIFEGTGNTYLDGDGTWASLTVNDPIHVYLANHVTLTNSTITLNSTLSTQEFDFVLDGCALVINSGGSLDGGGLTVKVQGTSSITQDGTFEESLEILGGTTTISGANNFWGEITVKSGATLTLPAEKTLTHDGYGITVETGATIAGEGSLIFVGENSTFENNGTVSVATTLEDGEGHPHILGDGTWSDLTIPEGTVVYVDDDMAMRSSTVHNSGWLVIGDYAFVFDGGTFTNEGTVSSEWDSFETEGTVSIVQNGSFDATLVVNSGSTTTSGTYSEPIIVRPNGELTVPAEETLTADDDVTVERESASVYGRISGPGEFAFRAHNDTLTNNGMISASTTFVDVEGGLYFYYVAGDGVWGNVLIESSVVVRPAADVTMENIDLTINRVLDTQENTLLVKGTSAAFVEIGPTARITGGGGTVQTEGTVTIVQGGIFDESLEVVNGTTTTSGLFLRSITVKPEGTLNIPSGQTLTTRCNVTVEREYPVEPKIVGGGVPAKQAPGSSAPTALQQGTISGGGSLVFEGYARTFTNNGIVNVATTFEDNDGDVKSISGDGAGQWSFLTIATDCSTTVNGGHTFTGAPAPLVIDGSVTLSSGSTIIYKGTSAQTVVPLAYCNLGINNPSGATLSGPAGVSGQLDLTSGAFSTGTHLSFGNAASILREVGSLSGTPTFGSSIDVTYAGTVAVTTGPEIPSSSTTLVGLTIDNSGGVTLANSATVNGTLAVTGGNLATGSNIVTLDGRATISETIPYSVIGKLMTTRACTSGVNENFGGMGVEINALGGDPGSTTVTRVTGTASTLPTGPAILRYFDISPATNTGLNATMVFRYFDTELNGRTESKLILYNSTDAGSTWTAIGGTVDNINNKITKAGINSFSRWTAGESYPTPTLTSISPTSGTLGATLNVTLTGTGFISGSTTVTFDTSITVNSVTVGSSTSLSANITISAGTSTGLRNVSATNPSPGGGTATLSNAFNVIAGNPMPTLASIAPTSAGLGATLDITLTGTGFANGVSTPSFGSDVTVNSFTVNSSTQITANVTVPASAAIGARTVEVTNSPPGGGTATLTNALAIEYPAPSLGSIAPNTASRGQTLDVVISGDGYYSGITSVSFGAGVTVNSLTITSTTQLTANITVGANASAGLRSVAVNNAGPGGGSTTLQNSFTINNPAPALTSVSPTSGNRGQILSVVLRGSNFITGLSSVSFGPDITVNTTSVDSATQITVNIAISPSAATGSRDVTVTHPAPGGGTTTLTGAFTIGNPVPTLSGASPNTGARGQTMSVTLSGTNFINGVTSVSFGSGITVNSTTISSITEATVNISIALDAALGSRDISVTNAAPGGGTATVTGAFTVVNPAPTLASITPTSGNRGQTLNVTVTGTNFIPGITTIAYGGGITVNSVSSATTTQVTANVTIDFTAALGPRDITVTNASPGGGTATLTGAFTVTNPAPTLTGISPTRAGRGSKINVVLTGTNFIDGASSVGFGPEITVNSTTVTSATQIQVNISVGAAASTGARDVTVTNPSPGGGTATLAGGFTVDTSPATGVENLLSVIPEDYALHEAYPNPFNPSTKIRYGLPERSRVRLEVYNMLGNVVAELVSGERPKGYYEVEWVAGNSPSGVYLVRLFTESTESSRRFIASRKVVLVK